MSFSQFVCISFLCAVGTFCHGEEVYESIGKDVVLDPSPSTTDIKSIAWKYGQDKAAEWDNSVNTVDYYGICKNRCNLNTKNASLIIRELKEKNPYTFSVELNGRGPGSKFTVYMLEPLSKPVVSPSCDTTSCNLTCKGTYDQHTEFSWKENSTKAGNGIIKIIQKSVNRDKSYICVVKNPIEEKESDPVNESDLFQDDSDIGGIIAAVVVCVLLLVLAVFCYWKRNEIKACFSHQSDARNPNHDMDDTNTALNSHSNGKDP